MPTLQDSPDYGLTRGTTAHQMLDCQICRLRVDGPIVSSCHHTYCWKCIAPWLGQRNSCPVCGKALLRDIHNDPIQNNQVQNNRYAEGVPSHPRTTLARNERDGMGRYNSPTTSIPHDHRALDQHVPNNSHTVQHTTNTVHYNYNTLQAPTQQVPRKVEAPLPPMRMPKPGTITIDADRMISIMYKKVKAIGPHGLLDPNSYTTVIPQVCQRWERAVYARDGLEMFRDDFLDQLEREMVSALERCGFVLVHKIDSVPKDLYNFLDAVARAMTDQGSLSVAAGAKV